MFDPYSQWLGIRDPQRPPNHYRLLGVEPFESDPQVLAKAADRMLAHVMGFRAGPYAAWAQRLLGELTLARQCLLHPKRKAEYDDWLRRTMSGPAAAPPPLPVATATRPATDAKASHNQATSWAVAVLTCVLLVLVGAIAFMMSRRPSAGELTSAASLEPAPATTVAPEAETAIQSVPQRATPAAEERKPLPGLLAEGGTKPEVRPLTLAAKPQASETRTPEPQVPTALTAAVAPQAVVEARPVPQPEPKPQMQAETKPQTPATAKPESKAEAKPETKPEEKHEPRRPATVPVPAPTEVAKAVEGIRGKYRDEYRVEEPGTRLKLIRRLVLDAQLEQSDRPMQYALLVEALDLSIDLGAVKIFSQIAKLLGDRFAVDPVTLKAEKLLASPRHSRSAESNQVLAKVAIEVAAEAMAAENYQQAVRLGEAAREMARRGKDVAKTKQAAAILREIVARQEMQAADLKAGEVLASQPEDVRANLARGKYLCFIKGDWAGGLPYLAKGADPALRRLAEAEKTPPENASQMAALADQWWDAVRLLDEPSQRFAKDRAAVWYGKAMPELTGAAKGRAKKRLDEVEEAGGRK